MSISSWSSDSLYSRVAVTCIDAAATVRTGENGGRTRCCPTELEGGWNAGVAVGTLGCVSVIREHETGGAGGWGDNCIG